MIVNNTISIEEEKRIKAEDVIGSVTLDKTPFERTDEYIKITFKVKSRSGKRKEPYFVVLPFRRKESSESIYKMDKEEIIHSCPEYTNRGMLEGVLCHHINAVIGSATENSEEISKKIRKKYNLEKLELDLGKYEREPKDVAALLSSIEKARRVKPDGRREVIFTYKKVREK